MRISITAEFAEAIGELIKACEEGREQAAAMPLIRAVKNLLDWLPICSVGSSGYSNRVALEEALKEFGEPSGPSPAVTPEEK